MATLADPQLVTAAPEAAQPDELLRHLGATARQLYDVAVAPGTRPQLEAQLEVVAPPSTSVDALRPGDLLVRVALGEGHTLLGVLVTGELVERRAAEQRGWQVEGTLPGRYALLIEGGDRPHPREGEWARRVTDRDGYLPAGTAILRLRADTSAKEGGDLSEAVNRQSHEYIRWYQDAVNRIDGAGLTVDGVIGPLTRAAVRRFQQRSGLAVDGIVGPQTEQALILQGATPPPGSGSPPVTAAATFALLVDANRDGVEDAAPGATAGWTWGASGSGAIVLVNNDDDGVDGSPDNSDAAVDSAADDRDLAPLTIVRTSPAPSPAGTIVELLVDKPAMLRVFSGRTAGAAEILGPGTGATFRFPSLAAPRFEFAMEAVRYPGPGFDGLVQMTLRVTPPAGPRTESLATVRVAPWLMPSHTTPAETVFVVDAGGANAAFRARLAPLVTAAGCRVIESRSGDIWMQDTMELGFACLPGRALRTALRVPRPRPLTGFPRSLLNTDLGFAQQGDMSVDNSLNYGGNLECTPPVTSASGKRYPAGRIYFGPGRTSSSGISVDVMDPDLREFLRRQVVQEPVEVNTGWLAVGHVDEILSCVPAPGAKGFKLLISSTRRAYAILDALNATTPTARMLTGRRFPREVGPDTDVEQTVHAFLALQDDFLPDLRDWLTLHHITRTARALRDYNADRQRDLDGVRTVMVPALGLAPEDVVEIPAVFMPNARTPEVADALTAGMVNMLVINGRCIIPKPFGPIGSAGTDLFEQDVRAALTALGLTVDFIDCWDEYHVNLGEVHCGTHVLRAAAPVNWWEFRP